MMQRRRFLSRSLATSFALAGSVATLPSSLWAVDPVTGGVLRRSRGGTLTTLDPHRALSSVDLEVAADCFTALTRVDANGAIGPACASRWQISSDGRRYEFFLRSGLRWSDGSAIEAVDIVASIRRLLHPETGALLAYRYDAIKGAANYRVGKAAAQTLGVSAPARDRVVVELEHPDTDLLKLLALAYVVPTRLVAERGADWSKPPAIVVSGAYRPLSWAQNGTLVLERQPHALGAVHGAATIRRVEWLMGVDDTTRWRLFKSGELDLAQIGEPSVLATARRESPKALRSTPFYGGGWVGLNLRKALIRDLKFRRMLALSVDRQVLVEKVRVLGERASESLVPEAVLDYPDRATPAHASWPMSRRMAEAKALAESLGLSRSRPQRLTAIFSSNNLTQRTFLALDAMWAPLGVRLDLRGLESRAYSLALNQGDFDLMDYSPFSAVQSATSFIGRFQSGSFLNYSGYSSAEVDRLIELAERQQLATERARYYRDAEALLLRDLPVIPLYSGITHRLIGTRVRGWTASAALASPSAYLSIV